VGVEDAGMLRNYLITALRALARHWMHGGITILGLAAGFAAAILVGLYVRDEFSFEHFIPGYQQVYRLEGDMITPGQKPQRTNGVPASAAADLTLDFPQAGNVARLVRSSQWVGRGEAKTWERVAWVDASFFKVMPFPALAGDPAVALDDPNGLVLTRQAARKFFGMDAPIGKTLQVQFVQGDGALFTTPHPMVVKAVLKDIPSATHLEQFKIYASGAAAQSALADKHLSPYATVWTYLRLASSAQLDDLRAALPAFTARRFPGPIGWRFRLESLKDLHFHGNERAVDIGIAAVGALIILIAAINFVALTTAGATRRAVEVGVRKAVGARRLDLVIQFMGEALVHVLAAMAIALAIVELALPAVDAFLRRTITFDLLHDPALDAAVLGSALLTGLAAGIYPALVLSSFRPATALKGKSGRGSSSARVRQGLVVAQFAILTCLIIVGATIWRQTSFILDNMLRLNEDQIIYFGDSDRPFRLELAKLPGVDTVAYTSDGTIEGTPFKTFVEDSARGKISIGVSAADVGLFEMLGLKPLAGRFFSRGHGEDMVLDHSGPSPESQPTLVLNESAVRQLGLKSPEDAVGRSISWSRPSGTGRIIGTFAPFLSSRIVGVVPDFAVLSIDRRVEPTMYFVDTNSALLMAKLEGQHLPETLRAINQLYRRMGHPRPIKIDFLSDTTREGYHDVEVQGAIVGGSAGLAIVIACLGLLSMATFTAERRTKEIGVRKANGAGTIDVLRLLLWQFTKPVLWANLLAWPLAFWAAEHWLQGYAYHVGLPPWLFLSASAAVVLIAMATVVGQALLTARAKPASALRYE
jgi:putative ABC transport system permease protein